MVRKPKVKPFTLTAMTKGGVTSLFRTYQKHQGVELISGPDEISVGKWQIVMTHPFPEDVK